MKPVNQITNYLNTIKEFIKNGGWCNNEQNYSYIYITYTNGEKEIILQENIDCNDIPCLISSKIQKIETLFSDGTGTNSFKEVITKENIIKLFN